MCTTLLLLAILVLQVQEVPLSHAYDIQFLPRMFEVLKRSTFAPIKSRDHQPPKRAASCLKLQALLQADACQDLQHR